MITGQFTGEWVNSLYMFGKLSPYVLSTSIIAIISFFMGGIFIYLYYKKFYAVGQAPKGWKVFFIGLILSSVYQILKIPFTYRWVYGFMNIISFLIFQVISVTILAYGLYLLKKEVEIK